MKIKLKYRTAKPFFTVLLIFAGFFQLHSQNNSYGLANQPSRDINETHLQPLAASGTQAGSATGITASPEVSISSITIDQDAVATGGILSGKIYISNVATSMINGNAGVTINIKVDPNQIDPNSFLIDLENSNLGHIEQLVVQYSTNPKAGTTKITIKKKDSLEQVVVPSMLAFKYVVADDLAGFHQPSDDRDNAELVDAKLIQVTVNTKIANVALLPPVSVKKNVQASDMNLYPNPAQNAITVDLGNYPGSTLQVLNMQGQLLKNIIAPMDINQEQIDIAGLPAGIYFVNINTNRGQIVKKFSKTN